jgi:hypothetical protein
VESLEESLDDPLEDPLDEPLDDPVPVQLHAPSLPVESHAACPVSAPWQEHVTVDPGEQVTPADCVLHPAWTMVARRATAASPARPHASPGAFVDPIRFVMGSAAVHSPGRA